jgi:hypothetical protein
MKKLRNLVVADEARLHLERHSSGSGSGNQGTSFPIRRVPPRLEFSGPFSFYFAPDKKRFVDVEVLKSSYLPHMAPPAGPDKSLSAFDEYLLHLIITN